MYILLKRNTKIMYILETEIKKALAKNRACISIFFDFNKAYDTVWRWEILNRLKNLGIKGPMFNNIKGFLQNRKFQVRVGKQMSTEKLQENGIPQEIGRAHV